MPNTPITRHKHQPQPDLATERAPSKRRASWRTRLTQLGIIVAALLTVSAILMAGFFLRHRNQPEVIGVSFSPYQAERYGMDWRAAYVAVLDELQFKHLRLPAYWDQIEPQPDQYNFAEVDWMLDEAAKRNAKVKLVIGQKLIRVPECYYPSWLDRNNADLVAERANKMLAVVVERYKDHPALEAWQLENEFLLHSFGECPTQNLTTQALRRELATVRLIDQTTPIMLTQSNQWGWPIIGPMTEYYGFSMYRTVWNGTFGYYVYPQRGIYNWWKAAIVEYLHPRTAVTIHELQAEAWGPRGNEHISHEEAQKSMSLTKLQDNILYARETNIKRFDLWGAEWWYAMKLQGHTEYWNYISSLEK
ncbi:beta-galactosidase [bacterium]|nr:beta-galactosidase [bacterium]